MNRRNKNARPPDFLTTKGTYSHNHHFKLFSEMMESSAWFALSTGARAVYLSLLNEYKGDYNGSKVICPYETMGKQGIRKQSIPNWLTELEALGFIKIIRGGMYKIPNEYLLIGEWAKIKTVEDARKISKSALDDLEAKRQLERERKRKEKESANHGTG